MHERIRALAEQNGFIHNWMPPGEQYELLQRYEKFAELIVRECSNIANAGIDPTESHLPGDDIKEYFGVE